MINYKLNILIEEVFYCLSVSLALFVVLELIFPRLVLSYINLSCLLLSWLVFAIILVVFTNKNKG